MTALLFIRFFVMNRMKRTTPKPHFLFPAMSYENLIDPDLPEPGAVLRATSGFIYPPQIGAMKRLLLLIPFLIPLILSAQRYEVQVLPANAQFIRYGDFYYENNYRGLRQLMRELPTYDESLYRQLKPRWEQMQSRQVLGITLVAVGTTVGSIFMLSSPEEERRVGSGQFSASYKVTDTDKYISNVLTGSIIMAVLGGTGALLFNRRPQVLGFINAFNNNSQGPKLRFTMSTAAGPGVGLQYRLD